MASAQLMEEELQQSVLLSEENAEYNDAAATAQISNENANAFATNADLSTEDDLSPAADEEQDDNDTSTSDAAEESSDSVDNESDIEEEDAEGEDEDVEASSEDEGHDLDQEDLVRSSTAGARSPVSSIPSDGDDDDDEGVGAVKIKPGDTDDDDVDVEEEGEGVDSERSDSQSENGDDSDGAATWEDAPEGEEDEEDEEDETATPNMCMFCKQDEEHDPGEEFEEYLVCSTCGENSHQQCARENGALHRDVTGNWNCPECVSAAQEEADEAIEGSVNEDLSPDASPSSRRSTAPKLARDLLPSQKGGVRPDSHSVFNQLVLDGDPLDGSRLLRKRKTSSIEADDTVMSLRKRRKNNLDELSSSLGDAAQDAQIGIDEERPRLLRLKVSRRSPAVTVARRPQSIIAKFRVNPVRLRHALSQKSTLNRKRANRTADVPRVSRVGASGGGSGARSSLSTPFIAPSFSQPFYSFFDRETDEMKAKPYGGILNETDADTSKTLPTNDDRRRFDEAKQKAEEEWRARLQAVQLAVEAPIKKSKKTAGPASQIECIEFGGWEIDTWYAAPYPEEYSRNRILYICEFCLKYMNSDYVAWRHKLKCPAKHPPGDEIYRNGSVSVFEVDGRKNPVYCQNLCLLAKLFLGSKTLYYDVEPFLFYVLCEFDDLGYHFVGYFSKEKRASSQNNVSCILTLPIHQRKGYGNLLIDFSYLLTRVEEKTGSPEKPLSDMGLVSYRNYWRLVMCRYLLDHVVDEKSMTSGLSVRQISDDTGLTPDDVISALEGLRCLVRDPQTGLYAFRVDLSYCNDYIAKWEGKKYVKLNPRALTWTPYVMGRSNATNFELGPAITAIAPREEDEENKNQQSTVNAIPNGRMIGKVHSHGDVGRTTKATLDSGVIESTEGKNNGTVYGDGDSKQHIFESTEQQDELASKTKIRPASSRGSNIEDLPLQAGSDNTSHGPVEHWTASYKDIPPARFEIFPPPGGRRPDRPRPSVPRPAISRTASSSSRPRRSAGSARRPTASRPKNSSSRRKTGGTGRGPGRWPKGTKKSDYGNADSGPGLPPAWLKERARLSDADIAKSTDSPASKAEGKSTMDVVRVQFKESAGIKGGDQTKLIGSKTTFYHESGTSMDEVIVGVGVDSDAGEDLDGDGEDE